MESPFLSVYYNYYIFLFPYDILGIGVLRWVNVMKQIIKNTQPVLNMENAGHWAHLKLLKVKHQNGFEGFLILTGARSQTTLIKPQYIALHVSGNPRFQYYSKPEWYFFRCLKNVTYLFFPPTQALLEVTKSAPRSAARNLSMWHKHDINVPQDWCAL